MRTSTPAGRRDTLPASLVAFTGNQHTLVIAPLSRILNQRSRVALRTDACRTTPILLRRRYDIPTI